MMLKALGHKVECSPERGLVYYVLRSSADDTEGSAVSWFEAQNSPLCAPQAILDGIRSLQDASLTSSDSQLLQEILDELITMGFSEKWLQKLLAALTTGAETSIEFDVLYSENWNPTIINIRCPQ